MTVAILCDNQRCASVPASGPFRQMAARQMNHTPPSARCRRGGAFFGNTLRRAGRVVIIYVMATIPEALAIAIQHHQAGRLQAAEQIYRQILAVEPNHADAIHLLGVIAYQVGKHEFAVEYIRRAIGLKGNVAAFHNNLGEAYRALAEDSPKRSPATAGHWN